MYRVTLLALTMPPSPMLYEDFKTKMEADRYVEFWTKLGHCHIRRERK